jgi:purine-binding chemotaxis protein CheW
VKSAADEPVEESQAVAPAVEIVPAETQPADQEIGEGEAAMKDGEDMAVEVKPEVEIVTAPEPEPAAAAPLKVQPAVVIPSPINLTENVDEAAAQSEKDDQDSVQMVVFTLEGQYYGIDIALVESIIKMQPITRLPHVAAYTMGLTNLRGKVVPVFSLRRRFGLADEAEDKNNRIIIIRYQLEEVGLMVDAVSEVETVFRKNIEPAPAMALNVSTQFINGIAKLDDRLVIFLDVNQIITATL